MNETFSSSNESEADILYSIFDAESISPPSLEQFDYSPSPVQHEQGRTSPDSPDVSFLSDDSIFGTHSICVYKLNYYSHFFCLKVLI